VLSFVTFGRRETIQRASLVPAMPSRGEINRQEVGLKHVMSPIGPALVDCWISTPMRSGNSLSDVERRV
jgi:hypothetical protein